jgi:hypothetical protein
MAQGMFESLKCLLSCVIKLETMIHCREFDEGQSQIGEAHYKLAEEIS